MLGFRLWTKPFRPNKSTYVIKLQDIIILLFTNLYVIYIINLILKS